MVASRYAPICFWTERGKRRNSRDSDFLERACRELSGVGVRSCFTSLSDRHARLEARIRRGYPGVELLDPDDEELAGTAAAMGEAARPYGMSLLA